MDHCCSVTALTRSGCAEATSALLRFQLRQTAAHTAQPSEPLPLGEVHFQAIEIFELLLQQQQQQQQQRVINLVSSNFDQLSHTRAAPSRGHNLTAAVQNGLCVDSDDEEKTRQLSTIHPFGDPPLTPSPRLLLSFLVSSVAFCALSVALC